jgi:hypothetical protein
MAMNPVLVQLYKEARSLHESFVKVDAALRKELTTNPNVEDHADAVYALRELAKLADEVRKKANSISEISQKLACVIQVATKNTDTIRTDHCIGTTDVKPIVTLPKQSTQPEQFAALMNWLGIPAAMWDRGDDHSVVKPHWPGMMNYLAEQMAAGRSLPPGVDPNKVYDEYKLTVRSKKGVAE